MAASFVSAICSRLPMMVRMRMKRSCIPWNTREAMNDAAASTSKTSVSPKRTERTAVIHSLVPNAFTSVSTPSITPQRQNTAASAAKTMDSTRSTEFFCPPFFDSAFSAASVLSVCEGTAAGESFSSRADLRRQAALPLSNFTLDGRKIFSKVRITPTGGEQK